MRVRTSSIDTIFDTDFEQVLMSLILIEGFFFDL